MRAIRFDDLKQYSDVVRSRSGAPVTVRFLEPGDAEELQTYFRSLSTRSRYNRFLGAMKELPHRVLDRFIHIGESDGFSVVATMQIDGFATIVGEARYAFHADTESLEFGLSIDDRWQGHGIGTALLRNLECRAAALGASASVRRYPALQRRHDRTCPQVRLRFCRQSGGLEAGAVRKAHRHGSAAHSLRELADRRGRPRLERSFGELSRLFSVFPVKLAFRFRKASSWKPPLVWCRHCEEQSDEAIQSPV